MTLNRFKALPSSRNRNSQLVGMELVSSHKNSISASIEMSFFLSGISFHLSLCTHLLLDHMCSESRALAAAAVPQRVISGAWEIIGLDAMGILVSSSCYCVWILVGCPSHLRGVCWFVYPFLCTGGAWWNAWEHDATWVHTKQTWYEVDEKDM